MRLSCCVFLLLVTATRAQERPYYNYAPVFSPDGTAVAFYSTAHGDFDVYTVIVDGGTVRRLTDDPAYDGEPSWSPDGERLVFVSERDGDSELFLINADGSELQQLTDNEARDDCRPGPPHRVESSSVPIAKATIDSTKSTRRAGRPASSRHALPTGDFAGRPMGRSSCFPPSKGKEPRSFVSTPTARELSRSSPSPIYPEPGIPKSRRTALACSSMPMRMPARSRVTGSGSCGRSISEAVRSAGSPENAVDDWGASWSRDGRRITFAGGGRNNEGYEIFLMNADGSGIRQLTRRHDF